MSNDQDNTVRQQPEKQATTAADAPKPETAAERPTIGHPGLHIGQFMEDERRKESDALRQEAPTKSREITNAAHRGRKKPNHMPLSKDQFTEAIDTMMSDPATRKSLKQGLAQYDDEGNLIPPSKKPSAENDKNSWPKMPG